MRSTPPLLYDEPQVADCVPRPFMLPVKRPPSGGAMKGEAHEPTPPPSSVTPSQSSSTPLQSSGRTHSTQRPRTRSQTPPEARQAESSRRGIADASTGTSFSAASDMETSGAAPSGSGASTAEAYTGERSAHRANALRA